MPEKFLETLAKLVDVVSTFLEEEDSGFPPHDLSCVLDHDNPEGCHICKVFKITDKKNCEYWTLVASPKKFEKVVDFKV